MSEELKNLLEERAAAFNDFTKKNDEMLAAKASGKDFAQLNDTVQQMKSYMSKLDEDFKAVEKKNNRPGATRDAELSEEQIAHRKAFGAFLRKGNDDGLSGLQQKAMNTASDPQGGYLVLPEMDLAIDRIAPIMSAMYRLADVREIGSAKWMKNVKTSGMSMRRVGDGQTGGETTAPTYSRIEIEAFTAEVEPWVYNETLEDAVVNLETDLAEEAGIAFAEGLGAEFITGNGVGKSRGITAYTNVANSAYTWGSVGYIASGKSAAFASVAPADKIISLQHALKSQYRPGAVFLMNDATLGNVRQLKDQSGQYYLWNPDPAAGFGGRLLGSPVEIDDNMQDVGAGSFSIAYANFKRAYQIVSRPGTSVIRDNITAKGTTKFNFRRRFGGGVQNFEAIKLMKFNT
jgi:HK97 family phage major capsid protein